MEKLCELSISFPEDNYIRLYSLDISRVLVIEIPDIVTRCYIYDALLLTKKGVYLPASINKFISALYSRAGMINCDIRIKMTSLSEERIRVFNYEEPVKSEYLSAARYEILSCLKTIENPSKKQRRVWTPSISMDNQRLLHINHYELRKENKYKGLLIIYGGNDLSEALTIDIANSKASQVVFLCDCYWSLGWCMSEAVLDRREIKFI